MASWHEPGQDRQDTQEERQAERERRAGLAQAAYSSVLVELRICSYPTGSAFLKKGKLCQLPTHMDLSTALLPSHFGDRKKCRGERGFSSGHQVDGGSRFQLEARIGVTVVSIAASQLESLRALG